MKSLALRKFLFAGIFILINKKTARITEVDLCGNSLCEIKDSVKIVPHQIKTFRINCP